ncbi:hypothetical protein [Nostoc parmelioides]|uniref:Uncharacterized protein n=1 Tax=Nostoc parmelioides FACHB-3921 TaxID=2692909 RepID=A0ABR8BM16_9NOSO|nr:hypothetical protein [Nostoc parmelioides]MBD2254709.1 hypothetical protein [Nostoc parmelioides FACHB-3921]
MSLNRQLHLRGLIVKAGRVGRGNATIHEKFGDRQTFRSTESTNLQIHVRQICINC